MMPYPRRVRSANKNFDAKRALASNPLKTPKPRGPSQCPVQVTRANFRLEKLERQ